MEEGYGDALREGQEGAPSSGLWVCFWSQAGAVPWCEHLQPFSSQTAELCGMEVRVSVPWGSKGRSRVSELNPEKKNGLRFEFLLWCLWGSSGRQTLRSGGLCGVHVLLCLWDSAGNGEGGRLRAGGQGRLAQEGHRRGLVHSPQLSANRGERVGAPEGKPSLVSLHPGLSLHTGSLAAVCRPPRPLSQNTHASLGPR